MLSWVCWAPLVLAGYAGTMQTSWHHSARIDGPYAEVQSCKDGVGLRLAAGAEWVQLGPQLGYTWGLGEQVEVTLQGHGGLGYSNTFHPISGVRQVTRWNGGLAIVVGLNQWHVKLGWDHMSNGRGADPTNSGQELWSVGVGLAF